MWIFLSLMGILIMSQGSYTHTADHQDWRDFFTYIDDGTIEEDVIDDWKNSVDDSEIDMPLVTDLIDEGMVEDIPDLFENCRYSHLLSAKLIKFYSRGII